MSGALLQLLAIGPEDVSLLTNEGSASFFQRQYKRHTAFAIQTLEIDMPPLDLVFGESFKVTIPRKGDLISTLWLEVTMRKNGMTYFPIEGLINSIQLYIGQQLIDTHTGEWFRIRNELFQDANDRDAYRRLTDFADGESDGSIKTFWLPITFFFDVLPLPLISLQMHNVEVMFSFNQTVEGIDPAYKPQVKLWADYVFLSNEERLFFAQNNQILLIEQTKVEEDQVQISTTNQTTLKTRLYFRHPVKYMVWTTSPPNTFARFSTGVRGETSDATDPLYAASLMFDTHERVLPFRASYYNVVQPYTYLKSAPSSGIHMVCFAKDPRDRINPSGSANFSKISTVILQQTYKRANTSATYVNQLASDQEMVASGASFNRSRIYGVNLNFLRIENGLGALAYAM